jgi:flagellar motor switch protein FliM
MDDKHELSQDEVDALLKGITGETEDSVKLPEAASTSPLRREPKEALNYSLGTDERIVRSRMTTLEVINERFARDLRSSLLVYMRRGADISVGNVQIQKYSDFVRNLPVPANINMVPKLVFLVVDNLFGSDGRFQIRVEGRDFTPTEQRIIKRLLGLTLDSYGKAWQPVYPLDFEYLRSELQIKRVNIVAPNEVVVSTTFRIEFGQIGGSLTICIPYSMIQPIRDLLANPLLAEVEVDTRWIAQLSQQVTSADVEIVAQFLTIDSSIGELLKLKVGDVLPVEIPTSITARVNGVPVMECSYGTSNNCYALRVHKMITHQTSDSSTESNHE